MKRFQVLFRDASVLAVFLVGIYLLFQAQSLLQEVQYTGDVIRVGKPDGGNIIVDGGDGGKKFEQPPPKPVIDPWMQC